LEQVALPEPFFVLFLAALLLLSSATTDALSIYCTGGRERQKDYYMEKKAPFTKKHPAGHEAHRAYLALELFQESLALCRHSLSEINLRHTAAANRFSIIAHV